MLYATRSKTWTFNEKFSNRNHSFFDKNPDASKFNSDRDISIIFSEFCCHVHIQEADYFEKNNRIRQKFFDEISGHRDIYIRDIKVIHSNFMIRLKLISRNDILIGKIVR